MYGNIAAWRAYSTARGDGTPASASDVLATAALLRASDYIRTRYVIRFTEGYTDALPEVEEATYIAANRELATPGFWSVTYTPGQTKTLIEVKGIKWETDARAAKGLYGSAVATPIDVMIDALLGRYTGMAGLPIHVTV
jgi:hypothetical protein